MYIHRVNEGEDILSIARKYITSPEKLAENNGRAASDKPLAGEELLVITPTRTYTVCEGDDLLKIARRFNVKRRELLASNPALFGEEKIYPGMSLAIKYQKENLGMTAANGFLNASTRISELKRAIPYLVYVTFAIGVTDGESVYTKRLSFDALKEVRAHGRIPLLRIYDATEGDFLKSRTSRELLCERIVSAARDGGYSGVVFAAFRAARDMPREYSDFIFEVRKRMIGSELIFFTECDEGAAHECTDLADGNILVCSKIDKANPKSFKDYENKILLDYAERAESSKTFVDICAYAYEEGKYIPLEALGELTHRSGAKITHNEDTLLVSVDLGGKKAVYESLENVKAKLRRVGELGFMGINIDISNTPISHLMTYYATFTPVYYNS